ncbi:MAG: hypothetical protein M3163_05800, partial [Actinomycetota bacterium]|nr:hypothetical protein [Actinomycetota bacterium]
PVGRLNADGALDTTFGTDGRGWVPYDDRTLLGQTQNYALAIQPDGKIVARGQRSYPSRDGANDFAGVSRFTSNGLPDTTFSEDGYAETRLDTTMFRRGTTISGVALQPDGRIVAVGQTYDGGGRDPEYRVTLYRYLPDGRPDLEFAGSGAVMSRVINRTIPSQQDWSPGSSVFPEAGRMPCPCTSSPTAVSW